jgi:hypothetical protein
MAQRLIDILEIGVEIVPEGGTPSGPPSGIPSGVTGLPTPSVKKAGSYVDDHKAVKRVIDKAGYKSRCSSAARIAADIGFPLEVVQEHLAIMEIDESAKFMETGTEDPLVCSIDALQRLVENLRKLKV